MDGRLDGPTLLLPSPVSKRLCRVLGGGTGAGLQRTDTRTNVHPVSLWPHEQGHIHSTDTKVAPELLLLGHPV